MVKSTGFRKKMPNSAYRSDTEGRKGRGQCIYMFIKCKVGPRSLTEGTRASILPKKRNSDIRNIT